MVRLQSTSFVRAIRNHHTDRADELPFAEGDVISVPSMPMAATFRRRAESDDIAWMYGSFNGKTGVFPSDLVTPVSRNEIHMPFGDKKDTDARSKVPTRHESFNETRSSIQADKHSMLEFAMLHFRESVDRYEMRPSEDGSLVGSIKALENLKLTSMKRKKSFRGKVQKEESWSWKEQAAMVKWCPVPIEASLLKLSSNHVAKLATECFVTIMQYMGDMRLPDGQTPIDCAFKILKMCHQYHDLRDEVYCQLCKQVTNNKSPIEDSCLRGWRLTAIMTCWHDCSNTLRPYLLNHLETNAHDETRAYHAEAAVCLHNLRKTCKFGGRHNVPSADEIEALTDGRSCRKQLIILPGGMPLTVGLKPCTIVQDVIVEVCSRLSVTSLMEQEEYTLFSISESKEYCRLKKTDYIMDVVTEMTLNKKDYQILFQRTSWFFPLRMENADFVDVMYSQCVPDYVDGYLLILEHGMVPSRLVGEIARLAALQHNAAGHSGTPGIKDVCRLLPGTVLSLPGMKPTQWLNEVQNKVAEIQHLSSQQCKTVFLDILSRWLLFGSTFFNVDCVSEDKIKGACLLAINRAGVHFLRPTSHEIVLSYPFTEVISTKKVYTDGRNYLDMKVGNLMVQKIVSVETDQGVDIAHVIGQYITAVNSSIARQQV